MSKKLLVAAVAAIGGALLIRRAAAGRNAEQDLWAEATDRVRWTVATAALGSAYRWPAGAGSGTWRNW